MASPSRRFRSPPPTQSNSVDPSISKTFGKLQCLVGEDRPFRALIKRLRLGYNTNREECTHGDRPGLFLRRNSKENDRGLLRIGWQENPCLFRIRHKSASYGDLGACIDHNAQVLLAQKLLSELARDAAKDMKSLRLRKEINGVSHQNCSETVIAFGRGGPLHWPRRLGRRRLSSELPNYPPPRASLWQARQPIELTQRNHHGIDWTALRWRAGNWAAPELGLKRNIRRDGRNLTRGTLETSDSD